MRILSKFSQTLQDSSISNFSALQFRSSQDRAIGKRQNDDSVER